VVQIGADARLQALDESIVGRELGGWDCTLQAKSDIYGCLVCLMVFARWRP